MSTILEEIADKLARDTLAAEKELDDDTIADQVGKTIGVGSPTFQEVYTTAIRMRRAEARGRDALEAIVSKLKSEEN